MRGRVFRLLLGAVLVPALVVGAAQTVYEYRAADAQLQDQLRLGVRLTATSIDQFVQTHASAVALAAAAASAHHDRPDLQGLQSLFPTFVTALATDAQGRITEVVPTSRDNGATGRFVADRDYFQMPARLRRPFVSNGFVGRGMGHDRLVAVSAPVVSRGRFTGIVEGSIPVDAFTRLRSAALRKRGHEMLVIDRDGRVIHASVGLPFTFGQHVGGAPFLSGTAGADGVSAVRRDDSAHPGAGAWVAWTRLRSGWTVALFAPRDAIAGVVGRRALGTAVLVLITCLVVLLVANLQIARMGAAIGSVLEDLRAIAAGERTPSAAPRSMPRELQPVAHEVVGVARRLQQANDDLAEALLAQQALADSLRATTEQQDEIIRLRTAQLERAIQDLDALSRTDPLTGALNLRGLHAHVAAVTDAAGGLVRSAAVVMFDVDFFKRYNDAAGHPAGDQVLRRIAAAASAALRGAPDQLARVGGEEFLAFLPNADEQIARHVAERIRSNVAGLGIPAPGAIDGRVTISAGVAAGHVGATLDDLIQCADAALYRAKADGRNCVRLGDAGGD
jgi:diguanylate cyclase (GGDEF)-like protein